MTYLARNFIPFSLQSSTIRVPLSLESRREMRHIETFFCAKKSTKFHLNKKLNFNKSVSYVRLRVGRVNIFIKFSRYWYYLLADKYELSARLLLYTWHSIHQDASDHKYLKRHEQTRQRNIAPRHPEDAQTK